MPTPSRIFLYWKDKFIKNGVVYTRGSQEYKDLKDHSGWSIVDWGEPSCWGCDRATVSSDQMCQDPDMSLKDIANLWNLSGAERCHIIPKAMGGSNTPENLFLLCHECHEKAPDTTNPEVFFKWVEHRRQEWEEELKVTTKRLRTFIFQQELPTPFLRGLAFYLCMGLKDFVETLLIDRSKTYLRDHLIEQINRRVGTHRSFLKDVSIWGAVCSWLKEEPTNFEKKDSLSPHMEDFLENGFEVEAETCTTI